MVAGATRDDTLSVLLLRPVLTDKKNMGKKMPFGHFSVEFFLLQHVSERKVLKNRYNFLFLGPREPR